MLYGFYESHTGSPEPVLRPQSQNSTIPVGVVKKDENPEGHPRVFLRKLNKDLS